MVAGLYLYNTCLVLMTPQIALQHRFWVGHFIVSSVYKMMSIQIMLNISFVIQLQCHLLADRCIGQTQLYD